MSSRGNYDGSPEWQQLVKDMRKPRPSHAFDWAGLPGLIMNMLVVIGLATTIILLTHAIR